MNNEKNDAVVNRHLPVLLAEVLDTFKPVLNQNKNKYLFLDGTLGGAGHSQAILDLNNKIHLTSADLDAAAIEKAKLIIKGTDRISFFHGNFKDAVLENSWDGVLVDLGYSSNQLEDASYGMSFMLTENAPLDMRLSRPPQGESAWDILINHTTTELTDIFNAYGEMRGAKSIAIRIHEAIANGTVTNSTHSLTRFLEKIRPQKYDEIHPATLVFQALRIAVNDELRNLDEFLNNVTLKLEKKGRLAVITFHSLEDRIVKNWGRKNIDVVTSLTKKPIEASAAEIKLNPRSRSAKLRIYEKK